MAMAGRRTLHPCAPFTAGSKGSFFVETSSLNLSSSSARTLSSRNFKSTFFKSLGLRGPGLPLPLVPLLSSNSHARSHALQCHAVQGTEGKEGTKTHRKYTEPTWHSPVEEGSINGAALSQNGAAKEGLTSSHVQEQLEPTASTGADTVPALDKTPSGTKLTDSDKQKSPFLDNNQGKAPSSLGKNPQSSIVSYVLRLSTSKWARSGLLSRNGGIQMAIIGETGQAISAMVYPGSTGERSKGELVAQVTAPTVQEEEGATSSNQQNEGSSACSLLLETSNAIYSASGEASFDDGGTAVVCLRARDISPVAAIWLAPTDGTWRLAEASLGVLSGEKEGGGSDALEDIAGQSEDNERFPEKKEATEVGCAEEASFKKQDPEPWEDEFWEQETPKEEQKEEGTTLKGAKVGSLYVFRPDERELLGSSGNALAVELRPLVKQPLSESDLLKILNGSSYLDKSDGLLEAEAERVRILATRQEGLEDYESLKQWLLLSTSVIILVGTAVATQIGGESVGAAFAAGGLASLLFIFKLQRQVDSLPVPTTEDLLSQKARTAAAIKVLGSESPVLGSDEKLTESSTGSILPKALTSQVLLRILSLGIVFGVVWCLLSQNQGSLGLVVSRPSLPKLEGQQVVAAVLGFLTHKVSVILAMFRRSSRL